MGERLARGPLVVFAIVVLAGALIGFRPFLTQKREAITSTPAAPLNFAAGIIDLEPGSQACITGVEFDPASAYARFGIQTYSRTGPPLLLQATAPGYAYTQHLDHYAQGFQDLPLKPAPRRTVGNYCITNAGAQKVALSTAGVGFTIARANLELNGKPQNQVIPLILHEAKPASAVARVPHTLRHAAAFWPLPLGFFWFMLFAVAFGVPLAIVWALRAGLAGGLGEISPAPAPAPALPVRRLGRAISRAARAGVTVVERIRVGWLVAAIVAVGAAYLYMWASRVHTWQADEAQYVGLARLTPHFLPDAFWNTDLFLRGVQRLEILMLAVPLGLVRSPDALMIGHAVNVLAFATTAVPLFLLARGIGAQRGWALLAAFLGLATPWAVYATSFMTEPLGYPLCAWTIWAAWRAAVRPGVRNDLLAFAMAFLAAYTRSGFLLLLVLPPLLAAAHELRYSGGVRALPAALWRRHRAQVVIVAAGLVLLVLSLAGAIFPVGDLTGFYGTDFATNIRGLLEKSAQRTAPILVGAGVLPFVFGAPWLVRQAVRPLDPARHAFAIAGIATVVLVLYGSQASGFDERYGMYMILPMLPAMAVALGRREIRPLGVAIVGVIAAVLIWRHTWNSAGSPYDFFVLPAESFYARIVLLRGAPYMPSWLPIGTAMLIVWLAVTALCAHAVRDRPGARNVVLGLVGILLVVQLAQSEYALRRFVNGAGGRSGASADTRAWVDDAIYGKARATVLADAVGNTATYEPIWRDVDFWNTSVSGVAATSDDHVTVTRGDHYSRVDVDYSTGRLTGDDPGTPYYLTARAYQGFALAGTVVAQSAYLPVDMIRADQPLHARWTIGGPSADGFITPGTPVHLRFYSAGLPAGREWCADVPLVAPADPSGKAIPRRYDLAVGGKHMRGVLATAESRTVRIELAGLDKQPFADAVLLGRGTVTVPGVTGPVSLQIGRPGVLPCTSA